MDDTEPMTDENCPQLYFSDQCENTISSMLEYAGESKSDHFSDQIDCLRYLFVSGANTSPKVTSRSQVVAVIRLTT